MFENLLFSKVIVQCYRQHILNYRTVIRNSDVSGFHISVFTI